MSSDLARLNQELSEARRELAEARNEIFEFQLILASIRAQIISAGTLTENALCLPAERRAIITREERRHDLSNMSRR